MQQVRPERAASRVPAEFECWADHVYLVSLIPLCQWDWVSGMACRRIGIATSELAQVATLQGMPWNADTLLDCRIVIAELISLDNQAQDNNE